MGETTGIAWTDATMNFWIGCTKVGPGCDHCYAENLATTRLGVPWGPGAPRRRTSAQLWNNPARWERAHAEGRAATRGGKPVPTWVFTSSLADFFDNEADPQWRADAWAVIRATPHLRWQIVTKRAPNVLKMLPADWNGGEGYQHVGIIASMVTQAEVDRDAPRLLGLKRRGVRWVGVSAEPQIERLTFADPPGLDWVIVGGESIQRGKCRMFAVEWARSLVSECQAARVPVFVKQLGSAAFEGGRRLHLHDRAGADPAEWPADLRVREMPRVYGPQAREERR